MIGLSFDRQMFFRIILISLALNVLWGLLSTWITMLDDGRNGLLVIGLGFVIVYGLTFFLALESDSRTLSRLISLVAAFTGIYFFSSIISLLLVEPFKDSFFIYLASLTIPSFFITLVVSKFFAIRYKWQTGGVLFLVLSAMTPLFFYLIKNYEDNVVFLGGSLFYALWQFTSTLVLAAGIAIE